MYDPTFCLPYSSTTQSPLTTELLISKVPIGNRMMFATLYSDAPAAHGKKLLMTMTAPTGGYAAQTVTDTSRAMNVVVTVKCHCR